MRSYKRSENMMMSSTVARKKLISSAYSGSDFTGRGYGVTCAPVRMIPGPQQYINQWPKTFNKGPKGHSFADSWAPGRNVGLQVQGPHKGQPWLAAQVTEESGPPRPWRSGRPLLESSVQTTSTKFQVLTCQEGSLWKGPWMGCSKVIYQEYEAYIRPPLGDSPPVVA